MKYGVESIEAIIGSDPEYADIGNPYGHIYGIIYFAVAYTDNGEVYAYRGRGTDEEAVEDAIFLEEHGIVPETFHRYVYGSAGWAEEEAYLAHREREDELRGIY